MTGHSRAIGAVRASFKNILRPAPEVDLAEQDANGDYPRTIIKTADPERYGINVGDYFIE